MLPEVDALVSRTFHAFRTASHLHHYLMMQILAEGAAHPGEPLILRLLIEQDGLTQRDLATKIRRSRAWVTKLLQDMEKAGMVARQDDDADQRLTRVFITERGREREAELDKILMEFLNKTVGALNEQELLDLERLLSKLIFNIEAAVPSEQDRDCG